MLRASKHVLALVLFLLAAKSAYGDVQVNSQTSGAVDVAIKGTIKKQDAIVFEKIINELNDRLLMVLLDSRGGDVFAAMKIGRLIREVEGTTLIAADSKCYSSCALIFIGGVGRYNAGEIGLHRPFFADEPRSRRDIENQLPKMFSSIKQYVSSMGVTENFYDEMINTEPSRMSLYDYQSYKKLVPQIDPVFQEVETAYDARRYGISTLEMRQREHDAETCFSRRSTNEIFNCQEAIKWGLSERVYIERAAKDHGCAPPDIEQATVSKLSRRERRDHPVTLKYESCVRNFMLGRKN